MIKWWFSLDQYWSSTIYNAQFNGQYWLVADDITVSIGQQELIMIDAVVAVGPQYHQFCSLQPILILDAENPFFSPPFWVFLGPMVGTTAARGMVCPNSYRMTVGKGWVPWLLIQTLFKGCHISCSGIGMHVRFKYVHVHWFEHTLCS